MQRFTISLSDDLARQFDEFIEAKAYVNRSEAVRDLIRERLGDVRDTGTGAGTSADWCVATVTYVYDHHEQTATLRLLDLQHDHHDLVVTSQRTHLDHDNCMETVVLKGAVEPVMALAEQLVALRGVRHGNMHVIPLAAVGQAHQHHHPHPAHQPHAPHDESVPHVHRKPLN
jgi:CopG family nickel-responsive transcriptional regulator